MQLANRPGMAAVLALVFLFAFFSTFLMIAISGMSFGVIAATICFSLLAAGVSAGLFHMTRQWDAE